MKKALEAYENYIRLEVRTHLLDCAIDRLKLIETLHQWLGDDLFGQVEDTIMEYGELREKEGFVNGYLTAEGGREP